MKFSKLLELGQKDKIEITKQQQAEIQTILNHRIIPHENHQLFEVNLKEKTINLADFHPPKTTITWDEAKELFTNKVSKVIDLNDLNLVTKSKVIMRENCIYISALNIQNVLKILKRDFNITNF